MMSPGDHSGQRQGKVRRRETALELLLLLGIVLIPLSYTWGFRNVRCTTTELYFGAVLLAWALLLVATGLRKGLAFPTELRPVRWVEAAMACFWLMCAVSLVAAESAWLWAKEFMQVTLCLGIYLMVRTSAMRRFSLSAYCTVLLIAAAAAAGAGVVQYLAGGFPWQDHCFQLVRGRPRSHVTFADPNNFAAYLAGMIPLAVAALATRGRRWWAWIAGLFLLTGCLICTCSRSGWLGTACGVVVVAVLLRRKAILPVVVLLGAVAIAGSLFGYDVHRRGTVGGQGTIASVEKAGAETILVRDTDSYRLALTRIAMVMIRKNPVLGVGLGNSGIAVPRYLDDVDNVPGAFLDDLELKNVQLTPHNTLLELTAELGPAGALASLAFVLGFYWAAASTLRRRPAGNDRYLLVGLVGGWTGVLAATSIGWIFTRGVAESFLILTGLVIAAGGSIRPEPRPGLSRGDCSSCQKGIDSRHASLAGGT